LESWVRHFIHWTLFLWLPPLAAIALWTAFVVSPLSMPGSKWNAVWIAVLAGSVISPMVAGIHWLTHIKQVRAAFALIANVAGLAANAVGLILMAGHAAG
jgi:hypothetical protein